MNSFFSASEKSIDRLYEVNKLKIYQSKNNAFFSPSACFIGDYYRSDMVNSNMLGSKLSLNLKFSKVLVATLLSFHVGITVNSSST